MTEISPRIRSYLNSLYGIEAADHYSKYINLEPAQYIRVNKLKISPDALSLLLSNQYGIELQQVVGIDNALMVTKDEQNLIGKTVEHIAGLYYIQGLSSMLPPLVLNPAPGDKVLDLCAAPGSKTTGLAELMQNTGTLIANEIQIDRVKSLVFNLERMSTMNCVVVHSKGELLSKVFTDYFDKVLVDAPCSGLGIIQKKNEVNNWWSVQHAERLGELQLKLLIAAIKMAKVGGEIVYSTCTLTPEENEFVIDKVIKKYPVELADISLPVMAREGLTSFEGMNFDSGIIKTKRLVPWEVNSDGFYIAKLVKIGETVPPEPAVLKNSSLQLIDAEHRNVNSSIRKVSEYFGIPYEVFKKYKYIFRNGDILFIDGEFDFSYPGIYHKSGFKFGTIDKRGDVTINTQAAQVLGKFAQRNIIDIENSAELKTYLDGGTFKRSTNMRGQCLINFNGYTLGTAVTTEAGIKSRFPRARRTQDIFTGF